MNCVRFGIEGGRRGIWRSRRPQSKFLPLLHKI